MLPFLDCDEELWDLTMNVNLKGTFLCCQVAIDKMLKNGGGSILICLLCLGKNQVHGRQCIVQANLGYKD